MPLGIRLKLPARRLQREMLADAGDNILQGPTFRSVIEDVVDGDERDRGAPRYVGNAPETARIVTTIKHAGGEPDGILRACELEFLQQCIQPIRMNAHRRHDNEIETFNKFDQVL